MSDVAARLEAAIKAGNVPDELLAEAEAEAQARGLQVHSPAQDGAPELMTSSTGDLAANTAAIEQTKKNRLSAMDAGEAEVAFEAEKTGKPTPRGFTQRVEDPFLDIAGATPGQRQRRYTRQDLGRPYLEERASLGDEEAKAELLNLKTRQTSASIGASLGLPFRAPLSLMGAVGQGMAAGGAGAAAESMAGGEDPRTVVKKGGTGALSGAALNVLIHGVGSFGAGMNKSLRENPDIGRDIQLAEKGGYKTSVTQGLKPPGPTGKTPGKYGVEEQAGDIAPQAAKAARTADEAVTATTDAARENYFANSTQKVDSTPLLDEYIAQIRAASRNDGTAPAGTAAPSLQQALLKFGNARVVPKGGAAPENGRVVPYSDIFPNGGGNIPGANVPKGAEGQFEIVLTPRKLTARELELERDALDNLGNIAKQASENTAPYQALSGKAREMRGGFGGAGPGGVTQGAPWKGLGDVMDEEAAAVGTIRNLKKAFGLPENKRLDENELGQITQIGNAIQRYKAPGNLEADRVIDDFLAKNPDLKPAFEKLSAMSAAERVRGAGPTGRVGIGGGGLRGMLADTILGSRLRIDPAMAALARLRGGAPMVAGAAGNASGGFAPDVEQKIRQMLMRQPAQGEQP